LPLKTDKIDKGPKTMSCNIWLISTMLGNYSGRDWGIRIKVMTVQRTKTATMQRQPKQIIEYNHM